MIRTFTLNPAIDVSLAVPELKPVHKNRASLSMREPGGGGVNVARLLSRMGVDVECVVAVGGATGLEVLAALAELQIPTRPLEAEGATRESVQIHDVRHDVRYRITVDGAPLSTSIGDVAELLSDAPVAEINVFSGSLPPRCPATAYADLSHVDESAFTIVDTSGDALRSSMAGAVDLVKPSLRELEELVGYELASAKELDRTLVGLLERFETLGSILVSLGAAGAVFIDRTTSAMRLHAPQVPVVSAVGAGDSVVAGIAWGLSRGDDVLAACRLGVAAGTATVGTPGTSLCSASAAENLVELIEVHALESHHPIRSPGT